MPSSGHSRRPTSLFNGGELAGEDERVERDVAFEAAEVELGHDRRQIGGREVVGTRAGVETRIEAEINRVRAVLDRSANAVAVTGWGEEFWAGLCWLSHYNWGTEP